MAYLTGGSSKKGAIIGGVVGGVALILILLAVFVWLRQSKKPKKAPRGKKIQSLYNSKFNALFSFLSKKKNHGSCFKLPFLNIFQNPKWISFIHYVVILPCYYFHPKTTVSVFAFFSLTFFLCLITYFNLCFLWQVTYWGQLS